MDSSGIVVCSSVGSPSSSSVGSEVGSGSAVPSISEESAVGSTVPSSERPETSVTGTELTAPGSVTSVGGSVTSPVDISAMSTGAAFSKSEASITSMRNTSGLSCNSAAKLPEQ